MVREQAKAAPAKGFSTLAGPPGGPPQQPQRPYYPYAPAGATTTTGISRPPPSVAQQQQPPPAPPTAAAAYPDGAFSGPPAPILKSGTASAASETAPVSLPPTSKTTTTTAPLPPHLQHLGPPPPPPQYLQGPPQVRSPFRGNNAPAPPGGPNAGVLKGAPSPNRSYPVLPDGVGSTTTAPPPGKGGIIPSGPPPPPSQWQAMHLPHDQPRMPPYPPPPPGWNPEHHNAVVHHMHQHPHARTGPPPPHHPHHPPPPPHHHPHYAYHHSPQRGGHPPPHPHYWRVAGPPPLPPPPPPPPRGGGAPTGGPLRNTKASLKKKSLHGNNNGSGSAMHELRSGATSPTEIETSHRDEVQIMGCTCKKTKCLKLYCQCFGVKLYCGPACRCLTCNNTVTHEVVRQEAMRQILQRNPAAFDTKFQKQPSVGLKPIAHKLGCKCRKSACMKKYCECYAGSVKCSVTCRCIGCKNVAPFSPNGGPAGSAAGIAGRPKVVRRKKSEPFQAAQIITFLKHGSPEVPKVVRRPAAMREVASMPSLASSSEGTTGSPEQVKSMDEGDGTVKKEDDVKTLLMAAYAMAEIGGASSPAKRGSSPDGPQGPIVSEASTPTLKRPRTETALL